MSRFPKSLYLIPLFAIAAMASNCRCTETEVPPGYVGVVKKPAGYVKEVLQPGYHDCWGRDKMVLIETREAVYSEPLSILCKDDLNFKFDLKVRARLATKDIKGILQLLEKQGSKISWGGDTGKLKFEVLYSVYVKPAARAIAREVVSRYDTTQIRENRSAITKKIRDRLLKTVEGTPVELTLVATSNFDYPDVITKAVESRRRREIEIGEEKAKQAMKLLQADNRLKIAQKMKIVRAAEAEAESMYLRILGKGISDQYLKLLDRQNTKLYFTKMDGSRTVNILGGGNGGSTPVVPVVVPSSPSKKK